MTTKTLAHLIIAAALAASAAASLQLAPSLASAPVSSGPALGAGSTLSGGIMFLAPVPNRFVASSGALKPAARRIVRLTP